jgi:hypothetical protein
MTVEVSKYSPAQKEKAPLPDKGKGALENDSLGFAHLRALS